jgi:hypothetical protein
MAKTLFAGVLTIGTAIIGVAILAVLISPRANTAQVFQSAGNLFARVIGDVVGPIRRG